MVLSLVDSSILDPLELQHHLTCAQTQLVDCLSHELLPYTCSAADVCTEQPAYTDLTPARYTSTGKAYGVHLVYFLLNLQGLEVVKLRLMGLELCQVPVLESRQPLYGRGARPLIDGHRPLQAESSFKEEQGSNGVPRQP